MHKTHCVECGKEHSGFALNCDNGCDSLLRAGYEREMCPKDDKGLWKYIDWLPCDGSLKIESGPITYKSKDLADELNLDNLYISFSGYWPQKRAYNMTCTFKDLEAAPVISWAMENGIKELVVASAGNTARAFAYVAGVTGFKVHLVVPRFALNRLWTPGPVGDNIKMTVVDGEYLDAIKVSNLLAEKKGVVPEGGARNIARRDGMGTVVVDATYTMRNLPDWYFQAVGSGTGAIAAWEASERLLVAGFIGPLPRLYLSQNREFSPLAKAWWAKRRYLKDADFPPENAPSDVFAKMLTNREPPYAVRGGLYDALSACGGHVVGVTKDEAVRAGSMFEELEGVDIVPSAAVAIASLIYAVGNGDVSPDEFVLLNVTGGGEELLREDYELEPIFEV